MLAGDGLLARSKTQKNIYPVVWLSWTTKKDKKVTSFDKAISVAALTYVSELVEVRLHSNLASSFKNTYSSFTRYVYEFNFSKSWEQSGCLCGAHITEGERKYGSQCSHLVILFLNPCFPLCAIWKGRGLLLQTAVLAEGRETARQRERERDDEAGEERWGFGLENLFQGNLDVLLRSDTISHMSAS